MGGNIVTTVYDADKLQQFIGLVYYLVFCYSLWGLHV